MRNSIRKAAANGLLLLATLVLCYAALEVGLRLWFFGSLTWEYAYLPETEGDVDSELGWRSLPNQTAKNTSMDFRIVVRTNSQGYRDVNHALEKPPGVFRVVLLGDSYMQAAQVEWENAFSYLLEQALSDRGVEVVNLGMGGYGTVQQWIQLEAEGLKYHPDLVLLAIYPENDFHNNSLTLSRVMWGKDSFRFFGRPYAMAAEKENELDFIKPDVSLLEALRDERAAASEKAKRLRWVDALTESVTGETFKRIRRSLRQKVRTPGEDPNIHLGVYLSNFDPSLNPNSPFSSQDYTAAWNDAREVTRRIIHAFGVLSNEEELPLAVFTVPSKLQVEPEVGERVTRAYPAFHLDLERPQNDLAEWTRTADLPFLDLVPIFREAHHNGRRLNFALSDSHWNAEGHRLAAESVAAWLETTGLIPQSDSPGPTHARPQGGE